MRQCECVNTIEYNYCGHFVCLCVSLSVVSCYCNLSLSLPVCLCVWCIAGVSKGPLPLEASNSLSGFPEDIT